MKMIIFATALVSAPALAGAPQDGTYKGEARWKGASAAAGTYQVETTIAGGDVASTYTFDGQRKTWTFTMTPTADGFFDVVSGGKTVGSGYCFDVQCHYTALDGALEETLTFYGNHLYKLGSKTAAGEKVMWEETLDKAAL